MDNEKKNLIIKTGLKAIEKIQFVAIILLSLVLIAGVDLITAQVGWNLITDPYFYISNLVTDIALLLITFGTVYLVIDVLKENDDTYKKAKAEIDSFAVSKDNIPSILAKYLETSNRKRKINQYRYDILVKLYKLENQKKWYAYIPIVKWFVKNPSYYSEEEMHIWNYGTEEQKAKSEYCRKKKMYEEQLNDELIDKIIDTKYVKYDKITLSILLNEYYNKGNDAQVNDYVTKNESGQIARFRIPTLVLSFGFTFLLTSLVLDSVNLNWIAFITIASKLLAIVWNVFTSYRYAKKHFKNITLHDVLFRRSVISEYQKWLKEQAEEAPKALPMKTQDEEKPKQEEKPHGQSIINIITEHLKV